MGAIRLGSLALAAALFLGPRLAGAADPPTLYDFVIADGRVIDPESGLDATRQIGVLKGRIAAISEGRLEGRTRVEAKGMIVAPGFVDIHSHAQNTPSAWLQAFDGVTTALELEGGAYPIDATYRDAAVDGRPINYGYSVGWAAARAAVLQASAAGQEGGGAVDVVGLASESDVKKIVHEVAQGLDQGGLGIGVLLGYVTAAGRDEYLELGRLAAAYKVPTFTHVRFKNTYEPRSAVEGFEEVIAVAAATGAHMHICHVNSSALRAAPSIDRMIAQAQAAGLPISTEAYPWGAGATDANAPFIQPANLHLLDIKPHDIEYLKTGERIADVARLREIQKADPDGFVVIHYLDEANPKDQAILDRVQTFKDRMIASDAIPYTLNGVVITKPAWPLPQGAAGHPRTAATFTTVLARYGRDLEDLSYIDIFRRGSLQPAQLLEETAPAMRNKGRIKLGADADLIVFDPARVKAAATYEKPAAPSVGMVDVIVGGVFVIQDGKLDVKVRPGAPIRATQRPRP
jgi:N-acyl-D-aspartate/D-glutamate deacylase